MNELCNNSVAVIGLGYVGLSLSVAFANSGLHTYGVDIDTNKITLLNNGKSYIKNIKNCDINRIIIEKKLIVSTEFDIVKNVSAVIICVPTPLTVNLTPDLSYIKNAVESIAKYVRRGHLIVLESTAYPGTTEEIVGPIIENISGLKAGSDFNLAFSPERESPGDNISIFDIPKVIGGLTDQCRDKTIKLYNNIVRSVVPVSSTKVAEAAKLLENIFRSVNIGLINELKIVYNHMNIDIWEVINAASTKPFGFMPFYPGPGLGGHCIPIDPLYLSWKAREFGISTKLIELANDINRHMPQYVLEQIMIALNDINITLNKSHILILGVAYKPDINDDRESPAYEIIKLLEERGACVSYNDPYISKIENKKITSRKSVEITKDYDLIILCTNHKEYSDIDFYNLGVAVVDCRNAVQKKPIKYYKA